MATRIDNRSTKVHSPSARSITAVDIFNLQPEKALYDVLKRASPEERGIYCKENKFKAMCELIKFDEFIQRNPGTMPVHSSSNLFKVVLDSFEDFSTGLALIEATHPGFIYSGEFKAYVQGFLKVEDFMLYTTYTLGRYSYTIYKNGTEEWNKDGNLHRKHGPAYVFRYENGNVAGEEWYKRGKLHNIKGPAVVEYYPSGRVRREEWYIDGKSWYMKTPNVIGYDPDGSIILEEYRYQNKLHRIDGPARVANGIQEWWINGERQN